jgi:DNA-binding HxlR family transcriptional regulator/transposase-like protein
MSARLTYSNEFKVDAVALAAASGRSLPAVAADLGIPPTSLRRWLRLARETDSEGRGEPSGAVDPLTLKATKARELEQENSDLGRISVSSQRTAVKDSCGVAHENADVPTACAIPVTSAENSGEIGFMHAMSRVRAVLGSLEKEHMNSIEEEHFTYFCAQLARYESTRNNPIVSVVEHIGNYWCNWILMITRPRPYRPSTIRKLLAAMDPAHPISQRMLTLNLRMLERDGLIARHVVDDVRRHVEYSLTPLGRGLSNKLLSLIEWIDQHAGEIAQASATFDGKVTGSQPPCD